MMPRKLGEIFWEIGHIKNWEVTFSDVQGLALSHGLGWAKLSQALGDSLWAWLEHFKSPGQALRLQLSGQISGKELGLPMVKKIVF
jgi:hypothetical protein